jgi:hypothetical protein
LKVQGSWLKVEGSWFKVEGSRFMVEGSGFSAAAGRGAVSQIEKETSEHRTSNIERPTSNNVFWPFKIKAEQSGTSLRNST